MHVLQGRNGQSSCFVVFLRFPLVTVGRYMVFQWCFPVSVASRSVGGSSNDEKPHVFFQSAEPVSFEAGEYRLASPPTPLRSIHSDA